MKNFLLQFIPMMIFIWGCTPPDTHMSPFTGSYSGKLVFFHGLDQTLGLFDPENGVVYPHIASTEASPNHLFYSSGTLLVTNSLSNSLQGFSYNPTNGLSPAGRLFLGTNKNPWMVIASDSLPKVYIPCWLSGEILVATLSPLALVSDPIPAGKNPQAGASLGGKLYVGNVNYDIKTGQFGEPSLTVVDEVSDQVIKTILLPAGRNPQAIIPFPSRKEVHVVCSGPQGGNQGKILLVSTDTLEVVGEISLGGSPSWSEGGIDPGSSTVFLSGVGGIQAYDYTTLLPLGQEIPGKGWYLFKGTDSLDDLWSGAFFDPLRESLFLCRSSLNQVIRLRRVGGIWKPPETWNTLNYPQGNFLLLP